LGRLRTTFDAIRQRLRARPDTEHEQAVVRPIVASVLFLYLVPQFLIDHADLSQSDYVLIGAIAAFLGISVAIFISVIVSRKTSPLRRLISITVDLAAVSYFLAQTDTRGLPLTLAYLWITLANGFRFGPSYLLYSMGASVVGFGFDIWFNPFLNAHFAMAIGLLLAVVAVDLYVLTLVRRMFTALARAQAANQAKRRFISVVSHEMRTPLNAIIGMTDLLGESKLAAEQADMVNTMTTASRALSRLIEDVLDFSKIEAGRLVVERTDFDLHALVNSTLRIIRPQAEAKGLVLTVSIMPEVPHALHGDPHYLRQVLINLASNAVKFTAEGSVIVHLSLTGEEVGTARVKFSVRDTGIGIPQEVQDRIFESFVQADQSTTRQYGGTGLGTAIAKQLVELMGGRMGLESSVGLGSTFWFELEFDKQPAVPADTGERALAGAPVLLVGFPAAEREPLAQTLSGWGAVAVALDSVEAAAQRLAPTAEQSMQIQCVLVRADRVDAARHCMVALQRATRDLPPLILCMAATSERTLRLPNELAFGFSAILNLPLQVRLLFNALHAALALNERGAAPGVVHLRDYLRDRGPTGGFRIIVADDSATNRQVIGKILERGGHTVTLVEDGERVLDAIETQNFDLVILDRNMPGLDGVATARALRAIGSGGPHLPIAILSADVTQETREECLDAGANIFLPKPLEAMRLLEHVAELCREAPPRHIAQPEPTSAPSIPQPLVVANQETLRLLEQLASQAGFVERLVATFVADHRDLMTRITRAEELGEFAEIRRHLHAMKGSAASLGAERLADVCGRLQRLTDAELARRADLADTIGQEFERARAALDRYLEERRRSAG
jgi:two-component system sensor histidine kinase RpfC